MARRVLTVVAVVLLSVGAAAAPVAAQEYPAPGVGVTTGAGAVAPGESVAVRGTGFEPDSTVIVTVRQGGRVCARYSVEADSQGTVAFEPVLNCRGNNRIVLSGTGADGNRLVLNTSVVVAGRAPGRAAEDSGGVRGEGSRGEGPRGEGVRSGGKAGGASGDGDGLPRTGGSLLPLWIGLGLVGAGGAALALTKVRRHS